jgi:hypothetical protein
MKETSVFTISLHNTFLGHSIIIDRSVPPKNSISEHTKDEHVNL